VKRATLHTPRAGHARGTALVLAVAALGSACREEAAGFRPLGVGDSAPAYAATTTSGDTVTLAALRGRGVVLNVWTTWCPPCREEMPSLDSLQQRFADQGLVVAAVSIDAAGDAAAVEAFAREFAPDVIVLHDPARRVERAFRTIGVPETFLIDREGRIARRWIGQFDPLSDDAIEAVRTAL
jgi:peroxiredoxin